MLLTRYATSDMRHALCGMRRASCVMRHAPCVTGCLEHWGFMRSPYASDIESPQIASYARGDSVGGFHIKKNWVCTHSEYRLSNVVFYLSNFWDQQDVC